MDLKHHDLTGGQIHGDALPVTGLIAPTIHTVGCPAVQGPNIIVIEQILSVRRSGEGKGLGDRCRHLHGEALIQAHGVVGGEHSHGGGNRLAAGIAGHGDGGGTHAHAVEGGAQTLAHVVAALIVAQSNDALVAAFPHIVVVNGQSGQVGQLNTLRAADLYLIFLVQFQTLGKLTLRQIHADGALAEGVGVMYGIGLAGGGVDIGSMGIAVIHLMTPEGVVAVDVALTVGHTGGLTGLNVGEGVEHIQAVLLCGETQAAGQLSAGVGEGVAAAHAHHGRHVFLHTAVLHLGGAFMAADFAVHSNHAARDGAVVHTVVAVGAISIVKTVEVEGIALGVLNGHIAVGGIDAIHHSAGHVIHAVGLTAAQSQTQLVGFGQRQGGVSPGRHSKAALLAEETLNHGVLAVVFIYNMLGDPAVFHLGATIEATDDAVHGHGVAHDRLDLQCVVTGGAVGAVSAVDVEGVALGILDVHIAVSSVVNALHGTGDIVLVGGVGAFQHLTQHIGLIGGQVGVGLREHEHTASLADIVHDDGVRALLLRHGVLHNEAVLHLSLAAVAADHAIQGDGVAGNRLHFQRVVTDRAVGAVGAVDVQAVTRGIPNGHVAESSARNSRHSTGDIILALGVGVAHGQTQCGGLSRCQGAVCLGRYAGLTSLTDIVYDAFVGAYCRRFRFCDIIGGQCAHREHTDHHDQSQQNG